MRFATHFFGVIILAATVRPCYGQFVRPPVIVFRPPPIHVPVHVPHGTPGSRHGKDDSAWDGALGWGAIGLGGVGVVGGTWYLAKKWRKLKSPRAIIRITAIPPGEAPEFVRWAWVGLELPLIDGQIRPENITAQEALSRRQVYVPPGYAVDGGTAVTILNSACPDAATWWRQNAPHVVSPGYQLVFPAEVCERLDDLGT